MLLLLLGIVQFAFIYNAQVGLTNAIRDSARFGSTLTTVDGTSAQKTADDTYANLTSRLGSYVSPYEAANLVLPPASQACVSQHLDGAGASPAFVRVTATYDHPLFVPIVGAIIDALDGSSSPGAYRISVTTELRIDNPDGSTITIPSTVCNP